MDKEYGGYLPVELNTGQEYYSGPDVMSFNCARSAISYVLQENDFTKLYLPVYMCESVRNRLSGVIEIQYYNISQSMEPLVRSIEESAVIMIPGYFGIKMHDENLTSQYSHIIFDNTQAFFQKPVMKEGVYNVYSCRKFTGVCDGAYLVGNSVKRKELTRYEPRFASYLLDAITYGTNEMYQRSLANEEQLEKDEILGMSVLSQRILTGIDYEKVAEKRKMNFWNIHQQLRDLNELAFEYEEECVPMVYPFLYKSETLRGKLVDHKIYIPQWWKYILQEGQANEYEKYLCNYLLPLPVDQRYGTGDMSEIADTIKEECLRR